MLRELICRIVLVFICSVQVGCVAAESTDSPGTYSVTRRTVESGSEIPVQPVIRAPVVTFLLSVSVPYVYGDVFIVCRGLETETESVKKIVQGNNIESDCLIEIFPGATMIISVDGIDMQIAGKESPFWLAFEKAHE